MQITVLIERIAGNGYRARGAEPLPFCGEGATRDEALAKLRELCEVHLPQGAELVAVDLSVQPPHPWMEFAGMFKDNADFEDVLAIMAENRRQQDLDSDLP